ncbi:MAG: hypothetical protein LBU53_01920 [Zoogloeaceae bacterium]|nr:hypothetical protein [Zoogloeaceae bacterium]
MNTLPRSLSFVIICFCLLLAGCDQIQNRLGLEDPAKKAARLEAEGKAVGGGCRQSGRAIEDCYAIYTWVPKESVFEGWREMDEYMRENNLDTITPVLPPPPPPPDPNARKKKKAPADEDAAEDAENSEGEAGKTPASTSAASALPIPPTTPPFSAPVPVQQPAARVVAVTPPAAASTTPAAAPAAPAAAPTTPAQP